ncbi:MAG TPA: hypothetical protein VMD59_01530, partial [Acidimicrobiales bacterium]|nr:hypothetical protein [Acidimicrobiales bacterium]
SVLIRDVSSWPRLRGQLRITVGTPEEDDAFLDALAEVMAPAPTTPAAAAAAEVSPSATAQAAS